MFKLESELPTDHNPKVEKIDDNGQYELEFTEETEAEKTARETAERIKKEEQAAADEALAAERRRCWEEDKEERDQTYRR